MSESKTPPPYPGECQVCGGLLRYGERHVKCGRAIMKLESDLAAARAEVERLTQCLKRANDQAEHFEREWYLRGDEVERLRKNDERWQFVRSKVSRIFNEKTLKMDGLRVEAYYDEPRAFVILPTDNGTLFDEAIDSALAAKEPT